MKKAIFILIILTIILTLTLTACDEVASKNSGKVCTKINKMLDDDFTTIKLQVETTANGITLTNKYTSTTANSGTIVRYTIQTLAEIVENQDGTFTMPSEMIVTETGSATVVNGQITALNGDDKNIPVTALQDINLKFDKKYFSDITIVDGSDGSASTFTAPVKDIKSFTGNQNFDGKDMTVNVVYQDTVESITITYTMNDGASVKVTYTFS